MKQSETLNTEASCMKESENLNTKASYMKPTETEHWNFLLTCVTQADIRFLPLIYFSEEILQKLPELSKATIA